VDSDILKITLSVDPLRTLSPVLDEHRGANNYEGVLYAYPR
jgi:hypothetical protein